MKILRTVLAIMAFGAICPDGNQSLALHAPTLFEEIDSLLIDQAPVVNDPVVKATAEVTPRCFISIDQIEISDGQLDDTLNVMIETIGFELGGCVLRIGVSNSLVNIVDILPGEIVDSCEWDMFRVSKTAQPTGAPNQLQVWQISGLVQGISGGEEPDCHRFDRPASLARIVVSSAHRSIVADTSVALFFYWESCRDNVISDSKGASILISDTVRQYSAPGLETAADQFPTIHGTPSECVSDQAVAPPRRLINFQAGGVEFRLRTK